MQSPTSSLMTPFPSDSQRFKPTHMVIQATGDPGLVQNCESY